MNMRVSGNMSLIARLERLEQSIDGGGRQHQALCGLAAAIELQSPHSTPGRPASGRKVKEASPKFQMHSLEKDLNLFAQKAAKSAEESKSTGNDFDMLIKIVQAQQAMLTQHGQALEKLQSAQPQTPMFLSRPNSASPSIVDVASLESRLVCILFFFFRIF